MNSKDIIKAEKQIEKLNQIKSKNKLINIKSCYIMKKIFDIMPKRIYLLTLWLRLVQGPLHLNMEM